MGAVVNDEGAVEAMSKVGVMVCGHGSRDENAVREFGAVAAGLRARLPQYQVESGFLEFATPIIRDGLDRLRESGTTLCLAVPGMLFAAGHASHEWVAAIAYGLLMALLWIVRRDLLTCVVAHAVTNLTLALYVRETGSWQLW